MTPDPMPIPDCDRTSEINTTGDDADEDVDGNDDSDSDTASDSTTDSGFAPLSVGSHREGEAVVVQSAGNNSLSTSQFPAYVGADGVIKHRETGVAFDSDNYVLVE